MRLVIDTNIIVSAFIVRNSKPDKLMRLWKAGAFRLLMCPELFDEIKDVLNRDKIKKKYELGDKKVQDLLVQLFAGVTWISLKEYRDVVFDCRDAKDEILLRLGKAGKADMIVSGDKDLEGFEGVKSVDEAIGACLPAGRSK